MTNKSFLSGGNDDTIRGKGALLADCEQRITPFSPPHSFFPGITFQMFHFKFNMLSGLSTNK